MSFSLYEIPGTPETAGCEGSTESVRVPLLLNKWRSGLSFRELQDILALDIEALRSALIGLQRRNRVKCDGRGTAALWLLADGRHFHQIRTDHVCDHTSIKGST
jgi:hypothetical protein